MLRLIHPAAAPYFASNFGISIYRFDKQYRSNVIIRDLHTPIVDTLQA